MPTLFEQTSFSGGQVSAKMRGRTDYDRYARSLEIGKNLIIDPEGSVSRRPGTQTVLKSDGSSWSHNSADVRLVPFRFSNNDQYILVFRNLKMDVVKNGIVVAEDIVTPWPASDLRLDPDDDSVPGLKFSQAGDFMVVTHPKHTPRLLARNSDTSWTITDYFLAREDCADSLAVAASGGSSSAESFDFEFKVLGLKRSGEYMRFAFNRRRQNVTSDDFGNYVSGEDFNTLVGTGNGNPRDMWSDGTTLWIADTDSNIYAYNLSTKARDSGKDITRISSTFRSTGIWSDGTTMWVVYEGLRNVSAFPLMGGSQNVSESFNLYVDNRDPAGLWSDGTTLWVLDITGNIVYAYNLTTKARDSSKDINSLRNAGNTSPRGLWSDGTTMWAADASTMKLIAYNLATKARDSSKDFNTLVGAGNSNPGGLWSDGTTMWVVDRTDDKIYSYVLSVPTTDTEAPREEIVRVTAKRDAKLKLSWNRTSSEVESFEIYQKAEGGFGFVGETGRNGENEFTVKNKLGDETQPPPSFRNPLVGNGNPYCSCLFQQRRGFGGFDERNRVEFSRTAILDQFDTHSPSQDDDAISAILSASEINEIRHMIPVEGVVFLLTGGGVWSLSGGQDRAPFIPSTVSARLEQKYGSSHLVPLDVGSVLLHVAETGNIIHATNYLLERDGYITSEMSVLFHEILSHRKIVDWSYVDGHIPLLICVLDDGTLLSVTYYPDEQIIAASPWELGNGYLASAVSVKNTDGINPIAIFYVQKGSSYSMLRMDFDPEGLSMQFPADGVVKYGGSSGSFVRNSAISNGGQAWFRKSNGSVLKVRAGSSAVERNVTHSGYQYPITIRTLPAWSLSRFDFKYAFLRLLTGSDISVKAYPGGASYALEDDVTKSKVGLTGTHVVGIEGPPDRQPQVQIEQSSPRPFTLLGIVIADEFNEAKGPLRPNAQ